jgi:membrane-associated protease RseP (regulator of RpoE activity)
VRTRTGDPVDGAEIVLYTDLGARHTKTDRSGAFALADLAPGSARLRVRAPGFATVEIAVELAPNRHGRPIEIPRIELSAEGIVEGMVVDTHGDPVPGARVAKDRVPVYLAVGSTPSGVAVTDARGRFRLAELADGPVTLEVYAPDVGRARADARVIAGRSNDVGRITLRKPDEKAAEPSASGGVAVTLGETDANQVVIVAVVDGSEAERAGIAPGDTLLEVDGARVSSMTDARSRLSGPVADDVVVKVQRAGRAFSLRIPREQVRR